MLHGEALELYRGVGDDSCVAFALLCLGAQHMEKGDHERASPFLEEALAPARRIGDKPNIASTLHNLAEVERQRGDYERAKSLGMESIALSREMEDKWQLAAVVGWVGLLAVWSGDEHDLAEGFLKEAVALDRELGNWAYGAYCLESFAGLAGARAQGARAARLWGAAEALRTNIGAPLPLDGRLLYEPSMAAARPTRRGGVGSGIRAGNGYVGGRSRRVCPGRRRPCLIVTSAGDGAESVANTPEPRSSRAFVK